MPARFAPCPVDAQHHASLSAVNYVDRERHVSKRDDRRCDVVKCDEAALKLLVPHEQLAKAIEPAMADLDHPTPSLLGWITPLGIGLLAAINHMRNVTMRLDDLKRRFASVARIGAQVLAAPSRGHLALDHNGLEHRIELRDVMLIGSGHDERQGDATAVHQQVPLAPLFFPDRSGWGRPLLAPGEP